MTDCPELWPDASDRLVDALGAQLTPSRLNHVLGVLATALGLAKCHGVPLQPVAWAALLHDLCKIKDTGAIRGHAEELGETIPAEDLEHPSLWHGWAAAGVARREWGIEAPEILDAIRYHSTGHPEMGPVGKVIFLADYLEPTRGCPSRRALLELARRDLDAATVEVLRAKCASLERARRTVHPRAAQTLAVLDAAASQEV
jgi:predicted HD superfamily hydrolase involved in NAD metabolism